MKSSILLGLTILLSVSNVFAQDSKLISVGKGNVAFATVFDSTLRVIKKADAYSEKYYEISCEQSTSGLKNRLILRVIDGENLLLEAEAKTKDCRKTIIDIYDIAFSETISADFVVSDVADSKGVYGLSMKYSSKK